MCITHFIASTIQYQLPYSTKLPRDKTFDHHVSICGKTYTFASKNIHKCEKTLRKTFAVQAKTVKSVKVLVLKPLYYMIYSHQLRIYSYM